MTHFAVVSPPFPSHVRALEALACELIDRGHRVTWVAQADVQRLLRDSRIGFRPVGVVTHPPGSLDGVLGRAARPGGPLGLRRVIQDVSQATAMLCRDGREALVALRVDAVIADQMEAAGGLLAEALGLPCISVACALPVNRETRVPLPVMPFGYAEDDGALKRNEGSTRVYDWLMTPHARVIRGQAADWGLAPRSSLADCVSPLLQLSQTTAGFDFPREQLPAGFHHVGPLRPPPSNEEPLGLPVAADRPFVFASLGTLQGGRFKIFHRIARACRALDIQLLVAHCGGLDERQVAALGCAGATWVTDFAPQRAAIARADVVVTHGGLNTVMDSLAAGKPMLLLPIAFDQPGVAARVVHVGAGLRRLPALAGTGSLRQALQRLLADRAYAQRAAVLGREVEAAGGVPLAADLIEEALAQQPVAEEAELA
ncbi:Zeaxanthin glucosyltransferase [Burkholderiales bacterium 8X]|nr:Zeaxanthin glucosyltransferase [Burkholderiales bacterium 8X]